MAVKIRLRRVGAKKQPAYRIVIADARAPRDGRFIEIIGHYNPLTEPSDVVINNERALHWLRSGAQPTESVQRMLVKTGVWSEYTGEPMPELPAKPEPKVEETPAPAAEEAPAAEAAAEEAPAEEAVVEAAPVEETPLVEAVEGEPTEAQAETEEKSAESEEQA
ncbi:MAG: 30S ribosomal protein S16 [Armatimonadota bacterium]